MDSSTPGFSIPGLGFAVPKPETHSAPIPIASAPNEPSATPQTDAPSEKAQPDDYAVAVNSTAFDTNSSIPPTTAAAGTAQSADNGATHKDATNGIMAQEEDANMTEARSPSPDITLALEEALGGLYDPIDVDPIEPAQTSQLAAPASEPAATSAISEDIKMAEVTRDMPQNRQGEAGRVGSEWEADSDPYQSSSDSSSDSSDDSDDDDDADGYKPLGIEETVKLLMKGEISDDEGDGKDKNDSAQLRTRNEVPEEVIPKPEVTITPDMKIEELGSVTSMVGNTVLILAKTTGEYQVLDAGSVLCDADRVVLGAVCDTLGKVTGPLYTLKFTNEDEAKETGIQLGTPIFYSAMHAKYVLTKPLMKMKGTDASNVHDEEAGDEFVEFSDDEKEANYKKQLKLKRKAATRGGKNGQEDSSKRPAHRPPPPPPKPTVAAYRPPPPPSDPTAGGLNYDDEDDDDGPYKPLSRPMNFGQGPPPPSMEERSHSRPGSQGGFRGGRGDPRGRGRGRGGRGWDHRGGRARGGAGAAGAAGAGAGNRGGFHHEQAPQAGARGGHFQQDQRDGGFSQSPQGQASQPPTGPRSDGFAKPPTGPRGYHASPKQGRSQHSSPKQSHKQHRSHQGNKQQQQQQQQQPREQQQQSYTQQNTQFSAVPPPPPPQVAFSTGGGQAAVPPPPLPNFNILAAIGRGAAAQQQHQPRQEAPPPPPPAVATGFQFQYPPPPPPQVAAGGAVAPAPQMQFNPALLAAAIQAIQNQQQNQQGQGHQQAPPPPPPQPPRDPRQRY